jgi:3-oxoacyl-[acyl-carrier protein] reductase
MFTSIEGRTVIVTGGTKGIGKGIARVMAKAGANVLVTGRRREDAERAVDELGPLGSGRVAYFLGDVADAESCREMAETAVDVFGGIDILCANAGIFPDSKLATMSVEDMDRVFDTNIKGS